MNLAEDDPHRIEEAVACLDLSGIPPDRRDGGRLAFALEFILRSTNIPTVGDPGRRGRPGLHDRREQGHQAHAAPDGGRALALRQQDPPGLAEDAAVPLATGPRGGPGERAGDVPADFRSPYAMFHTFIDAFKKRRPRRGRDVPGPDRGPRPGPPGRRQGAGVQAQGGPRPVHLRDLPGPPGLLGRRPAGGAGPQGGADHRGAAGRGRAQGAVAVQPGHGPVPGPALRRVRVEAHRPRTGGDRPDGRRARVRARARAVAPSPDTRAGSGIGSDLRAHSRSPCISSSGWSCSSSWSSRRTVSSSGRSPA